MPAAPSTAASAHAAPTGALPIGALSLVARFTRTQVVWSALAVSMTAAAGLLWALNGAPGPQNAGAPLAAPLAELAPAPAQGWDGLLFDRLDREAEADRAWNGIVIHHSGTNQGSAESIARIHEGQGIRGLGYHFVIGNGAGQPDGEIAVGFRWSDQLPGAHIAGPMPQADKNRKIGICLVGDGDRRPFTEEQLAALASLVTSLQERYAIPAERVTLHRDLASTASPGRFFPETLFRQSLLP
jgi:hypothetical protein